MGVSLLQDMRCQRLASNLNFSLFLSSRYGSLLPIIYDLMTDHRLEHGRESLSGRLSSINDLSHILQLLFRQFDVTGCPVLFQA